MTSLMLGLLCALIVGVVASLYFWGVRRGQDESAQGILSLSAMRWREFASLVVEMLFRRGYTAADQHPLGSGDQSDRVLRRDDGLCVLSCKHGSAYRLGGSAVDELANSVRMHDAVGGIMVTPGSFAPDARQQAGQQRIELIDGKALWPEIAPSLPEPLRKQVETHAAKRAWRSIGLAWLAAVAVGAAVTLLTSGSDDERSVTSASAPASSTASADGSKTASAAQAAPTAALNEQQIEQRRRDAASAIAALPGVERALWSTQSTLTLDMADARDRWGGICDILDSYEELRATRVQINPPPGSGVPVRFKQCHTY